MGTFKFTTKENVARQLDVTRTILPHFRKNINGIFTNTSSIGCKTTFPLLQSFTLQNTLLKVFMNHYIMNQSLLV
ncbi:hypothetical protein [Tenacibaculum sp. C7A-26P2]|uniref:hypothetical protein n=1 Tax=Tenacibaculum sp. C7A-26P2 TaxID=3447504 RepID=UPI003F84926A